MDQVLRCRLLNWHRLKWCCLYNVSTVKLEILPSNSAFTSPFLGGKPRCRGCLTAVANKLFEFSSPTNCGKGPEISSFSASAQPQELILWEFTYPYTLESKMLRYVSIFPLHMYMKLSFFIPTSVQKEKEFNYFGGMGETKRNININIHSKNVIWKQLPTVIPKQRQEKKVRSQNTQEKKTIINILI